MPCRSRSQYAIVCSFFNGLRRMSPLKNNMPLSSPEGSVYLLKKAENTVAQHSIKPRLSKVQDGNGTPDGVVAVYA